MNTSQVAEKAGVSYRQIDHWCTQGWLKPNWIPGTGRGGRIKDFDFAQKTIAIRMAKLIEAGVRPEVAARIARGEHGAVNGLLAAVAPCLHDGELTWHLGL